MHISFLCNLPQILMMKLCVTYPSLCQEQTVHTYMRNSKHTAKKNPVSLQHANVQTLKSFMFFTGLWYC